MSFNICCRALLSLLLVVLTACTPSSKVQFYSTDITGANFGNSFSVTDTDGKIRTLDEFRGKVVVLYFGYTHCPDMCPVTLHAMNEVVKGLGEDGKRVQVLFLTLDPERDTAEILSQYVHAFNLGFIALRMDSKSTAAFAAAFRSYAKRTNEETDGSYMMDHSTGTYVYDPQGNLRLYLRTNQAVSELLADFKNLLR